MAAACFYDSVYQTYEIDIPAAEWNAGAKLFGATCDYTTTPEERAACLQMETESIGVPIRDAATSHLSFMASHPAASCFADSYAADRPVANAYLTAANYLLSTLTLYGDDWTAAMQSWQAWIAKADVMSQTFLQNWNGYFADCH